MPFPHIQGQLRNDGIGHWATVRPLTGDSLAAMEDKLNILPLKVGVNEQGALLKELDNGW